MHINQDVAWWALTKAEYFLHNSSLRARALKEVMKQIDYEVSILLTLPTDPCYVLFLIMYLLSGKDNAEKIIRFSLTLD